ncbi:MAG: hypothetical protein Q9167_001981 [Letrouitia subvulpina]
MSDTSKPPKERAEDENTHIKSDQAAISDPVRDCVFPPMKALSLYNVSSLANSASKISPIPTPTPTQEPQTQPLDDKPPSNTPSSDYTDLEPNQTSKANPFEPPVRHREKFKQRLIRFLSCAPSIYEPDGVCKGTENGKYYCLVVKRNDAFGHCWEAPDGQIHCNLKPRGICWETDDGQVECNDKEKRQECWEASDGQIHCWVDDDKGKRSSTDDELIKRSANEIEEIKRSFEQAEKTKRDPKKKKGKHHPKPSYPDCGAPICFHKRFIPSHPNHELPIYARHDERSNPSYPDCGAPICFVKRELQL